MLSITTNFRLDQLGLDFCIHSHMNSTGDSVIPEASYDALLWIQAAGGIPISPLLTVFIRAHRDAVEEVAGIPAGHKRKLEAAIFRMHERRDALIEAISATLEVKTPEGIC